MGFGPLEAQGSALDDEAVSAAEGLSGHLGRASGGICDESAQRFGDHLDRSQLTIRIEIVPDVVFGDGGIEAGDEKGGDVGIGGWTELGHRLGAVEDLVGDGIVHTKESVLDVLMRELVVDGHLMSIWTLETTGAGTSDEE